MVERSIVRKSLWMRYVDFEKVKDLLHLVHERNGKLRAGELERLGIEERILVKDEGQPLGRYRRYNYRKVMENLGLAEVKNRLYYTSADERVLEFLELTDFKKTMSARAKEILRAIIVEDDDCRRYFFNIFMETSSYKLQDFRKEGKSIHVETKSIQSNSRHKEQIILGGPTGNVIELTTQDEINAVYWGVRSWALDLGITDEFMTSFNDGRIIYPIDPSSSELALNRILLRKMSATKDGSKWLLIHIPAFIKECALSTRLPIKKIKEFLLQLKEKYPQLVMFVPSSTAFIDIRTPFESQDSTIRNSYLYIERKGYISHLRINENIRKEVSIMNEVFMKEKYKLSRNPFPPAASGIDIESNLYIPAEWMENIERYYEELSGGMGAKAFPVIGEYGTGKTVLLKGYLREFFERRRIKTFYFENPGAQFYDLANILMRNLGRNEFSKALWERCKEYLPKKGQMDLIPKPFSTMLAELRNKRDREKKASEFQKVIMEELRLTTDEEVAYKLALMIVETANKPYFEYRDFVAGLKGSLVAEREEPKYFKAIIKSITEIYNVEGVAFLVDEFENIAISKRMTRSKAYEYLATLRHLIDISEEENLWIVMAMTPQAAETTGEMDIALWDRFTHGKSTALKLEPLPREESKKLLIWWLNRAREFNGLREYRDKLYPFPEELLNLLDNSPEFRSPRKLVRLGFFTLARAQQEREEAPISLKFIGEIVGELYPEEITRVKDDKD